MDAGSQEGDAAVRVDQPGTMLRDFQTERPLKGDPMPLTHRCYLADAKFLAALGATGISRRARPGASAPVLAALPGTTFMPSR